MSIWPLKNIAGCYLESAEPLDTYEQYGIAFPPQFSKAWPWFALSFLSSNTSCPLENSWNPYRRNLEGVTATCSVRFFDKHFAWQFRICLFAVPSHIPMWRTLALALSIWRWRCVTLSFFLTYLPRGTNRTGAWKSAVSPPPNAVRMLKYSWRILPVCSAPSTAASFRQPLRLKNKNVGYSVLTRFCVGVLCIELNKRSATVPELSIKRCAKHQTWGATAHGGMAKSFEGADYVQVSLEPEAARLSRASAIVHPPPFFHSS